MQTVDVATSKYATTELLFSAKYFSSFKNSGLVFSGVILSLHLKIISILLPSI